MKTRTTRHNAFVLALLVVILGIGACTAPDGGGAGASPAAPGPADPSAGESAAPAAPGDDYEYGG